MLIHSTSHSTVTFALLLKQHHAVGVRGCILWKIQIFSGYNQHNKAWLPYSTAVACFIQQED